MLAKPHGSKEASSRGMLVRSILEVGAKQQRRKIALHDAKENGGCCQPPFL
jgi:hypothetical protein